MRTRFMLGAAVMAAACLSAQPAAAQWSMDLASVAEQEFQVPAGTEASITIVNKAPRVRYHVATVLRPIQIPPLPAVGLRVSEVGGGCPDLVKTAETLQAATEETSVRTLVLQLQLAIPTADCDGQQLTFIRAVMAGTVMVLPVRYVIGAGEELVVTVQKLKADGTVEKTWKLTLTTGAPGSWRTLYGLAVFQDRDDDPFLTPGAKDGEFIVNPGLSKDRGGHPLKPAPSVFFSWLSRSAELGPISVSPTLGLGATSELPGLFGGIAVTYRQNLALVVGIPVVTQRHVKEKYVKDPTVTTALTTDDLTDTKYYADKWFIGGVFRFSSNPFGEAKKPAKEKP